VCHWEVADCKDYQVYHSRHIPGLRLRCLLLVQVDRSGYDGKVFHLSLEGDCLSADIWTSDRWLRQNLADTDYNVL
jgi:hypothetical protein